MKSRKLGDIVEYPLKSSEREASAVPQDWCRSNWQHTRKSCGCFTGVTAAAVTQKLTQLLQELRPSRVTADEIVAGHDLSGRTIVVTGGNSGTPERACGASKASCGVQRFQKRLD